MSIYGLDANHAYQRMLSGDVKFRMVLTMGECNDAHQ
jgi:D-arabinose 1-dehydrogenase-like Zn-dependent alcohol dehydrogenase